MPEAVTPETPAKKGKKAVTPETPAAPTTAPTQETDSSHGVSGHPIKEYVAPEPTGFPKSQTVYQADQAVKGDYIVEWIQNSEHVKFHPESDGKFHPLNEQRVIPTIHTRVFKTEEEAEEFASQIHTVEDAPNQQSVGKSKYKGAKIFRK